MEIAGNNTPWYLLSELGRILLTEIGHAQHCAEPYLGLGHLRSESGSALTAGDSRSQHDLRARAPPT
jgi:hypothetical protein